MEEHGSFLSCDAQVPDMTRGSHDWDFFSGTSPAVVVSPGGDEIQSLIKWLQSLQQL
jgi:hypothetical protein